MIIQVIDEMSGEILDTFDSSQHELIVFLYQRYFITRIINDFGINRITIKVSRNHNAI